MPSQFNLKSISHFRTELMGLAALLIIICHSTQGTFPIETTGILHKLIVAGNYGVDVFLFLSGFGLFCSLINVFEGEGSLISWYKRRLTRILVPYFILVVPLWCVVSQIEEWRFESFLWHASTLSYWTHHDGVWFLSLLIPLYLITPLYGWLARKYRLVMGLVTVILWGVVICFGPSSYEMSHLDKTNVLINIEFCLIRLPSFFVGYWLASHIRMDVCIPLWSSIALPLTGIIIGHLWYTRFQSLNYLCSGLLIVVIAIFFIQKMGGAKTASCTLWESSH